jgi:hypothetical protein
MKAGILRLRRRRRVTDAGICPLYLGNEDAEHVA